MNQQKAMKLADLPSSKDGFVRFFSKEIKNLPEKLEYWNVEQLLFAIADRSDWTEFKDAVKYVLKRFQ